MNWSKYFKYLDRLYVLWAFVALGGVILFQDRINNGLKFLLLAGCALVWLVVERLLMLRRRRKK